jgi:hypothetical protein
VTCEPEVPGSTFYWDPVTIFPGVFAGRLAMLVAADGLLYGTFTRRPDAGPEHDVSRWHITPDGQFCRTWHVWDHRRERCSVVYRQGETFELEPKDRFAKEVYQRVLGNPEGY